MVSAKWKLSRKEKKIKEKINNEKRKLPTLNNYGSIPYNSIKAQTDSHYNDTVNTVYIILVRFTKLI